MISLMKIINNSNVDPTVYVTAGSTLYYSNGSQLVSVGSAPVNVAISAMEIVNTRTSTHGSRGSRLDPLLLQRNATRFRCEHPDGSAISIIKIVNNPNVDPRFTSRQATRFTTRPAARWLRSRVLNLTPNKG